MKKKNFLCLIMAAAVSLTMLAIPAYAEGETGVTPQKSESFSATTISGTTISGDNGLGISKAAQTRVTAAVKNDGLGGKSESDKYLVVNRQQDDAATYFLGLNFALNNANKYTNAMTISFSVYAPENLDSTPFFVQLGLSDTASPTGGGVYFVTDESAVVMDSARPLGVQRFLVNTGEWNRVSITMIPGTANTKVNINGNAYEYTILANNALYGEYLSSIRLQLPSRNGQTNDFVAYDDFYIYDGDVTETYKAPSNALIIPENAEINEDKKLITIDGEFSESDFSISDGYTMKVIKNSESKAVKIAVWETGNPVPSYYKIKRKGEPDKKEDFSAITITGTEISANNELGVESITHTRAVPQIENMGLGGKPGTDKYMRLTRYSEADAQYGYYQKLVLNNSESNKYTDSVTLSLSIYVPEDLGIDGSFAIQSGLAAADAEKPTGGGVYFVTDKRAVRFDETKTLLNQKFLVNVGEWNRISITMTPNTANTKITVNGRVYECTKLSNDAVYGNYLRIVNLQLPNRTGKTDEYLAYDDIFIYEGDVTEVYTAPANALQTTSDTNFIDSNSIYTINEFNASNFSVSDGNTMVVMNAENNIPAKLAVWTNNNPVPKYYAINNVNDGEVVSKTLTADNKSHRFIARGFGKGNAGTVIIAKYNSTGDQMISNVEMREILNINGSFEEVFTISDYDASNIYKAFWWGSLNDLSLIHKCSILNAEERN